MTQIGFAMRVLLKAILGDKGKSHPSDFKT